MLSNTEACPLSTTGKRQNLLIIQPHTKGKAGYHFVILLSEVSNNCSASAIPTVQMMWQQQFCPPSCTVIILPKMFSSVKWNWTLYKRTARSFLNEFFKTVTSWQICKLFQTGDWFKKGTSTNELFHISIKNIILETEEAHIHSYDLLNTAALSQGTEIIWNKKLISLNKNEDLEKSHD